jgi:3-isopropylmalate/(R)-2-methylmalate dehydratase small subunit
MRLGASGARRDGQRRVATGDRNVAFTGQATTADARRRRVLVGAMTPFIQHTGVACPLGLANVDTDQLIPARFLKLKRSDGLGPTLLADLRVKDGHEAAAFPLNQPAWRAASILVARRNFGSGSSREAAVYALVDFGIRVVLAPSFGDIFSSNAVKNGLLAGIFDDALTEELLAALEAKPDLPVTVDLAALTVAWGNRVAPFSTEPAWISYSTAGMIWR